MALSVRALLFDPQAPWWSIGGGICIAMLAVTIACWGRRPAFLYYAGAALNFAAAAWWFYSRSLFTLDFIAWQAIAAAVPGIAWLVLELQIFRRPPPIPRRRLPAVHHIAAIGSAVIAVLVTISITVSRIGDNFVSHSPLLPGAALASAIAILFACLWDYRARYALTGLYVLGLAAICAALDIARISPAWFPWALVGCAAGYGVITSLIFNRAPRLEILALEFGIPPQSAGAGYWLPNANSIIAAVTAAMSCVGDFQLDPSWRRALIATAALSQALSFALLSRRSRPGENRFAAMATLAIGAVLWGWAWLPIDAPYYVQHCAIAFIVFSIAACAVALLLPRLLSADNAWGITARSPRPWPPRHSCAPAIHRFATTAMRSPSFSRFLPDAHGRS